MIVDGREASQYCHRPPYALLGSAGAWAEMDHGSLCSDARPECHSTVISSLRNSSRLSDGFHQFTDPDLGGLFGFDFAEVASVYGADGLLRAVPPVHTNRRLGVSLPGVHRVADGMVLEPLGFAIARWPIA